MIESIIFETEMLVVCSKEAQQCIQCPILEFPSNARNHCLPKSLTFLAFEDSLCMALTCTALFFSVITAMILVLFVKHYDTDIVKANNHNLSLYFSSFVSFALCSSLEIPAELPGESQIKTQQLLLYIDFLQETCST